MTPGVLLLLAANVAVFLLQRTVPGLTEQLVFFPPAVTQTPWTVVTSMFAHADFWHIGFNMFALWMFGPRVELRFGTRRFLGLYFTAGLVGSLAGFLVPNAAYLGASGAIFGVALAYARYWPHDKVLIYGVLPMTTRTMVILYALIELVSGVEGFIPGVAHFIHLGGFLGGWLYCAWLDRRTGAARFRRMANPANHAPSLADALAGRIERWNAIDASQLHPVNREELERIRAKLSSQGLGALTEGDVEFLERFSGR